MFSAISRRLSYANVPATLALLFSMSGGALAARHYLINSSKQINPKVLKALKGSNGRNGSNGAKGTTGPQGAKGEAGPTGKEGLAGQEGLAGKAGATGPTGPTGLAGSARDVGSISPGNETTPASLRTEGLKGWVSVTRRSAGDYCLRPDSSITLGNAVLLVSLGNNGGGGAGSVVVRGVCSFSPLEYWVDTFNAAGTPTDQDFTAIIP